MSITATGMAIRPGPENLVVIFTIEDVQYTFASNLSFPLPPFQAEEARISYEHPGQLISSKNFHGTLQEGQLNITLDDGVNITATIQPPLDIGPIDGDGFWQVDN